MNIQKSLKITVISLIFALCLISCTKSAPVSKSGLYFDTIVSVELYGAGSDADALLDECMSMCDHYEKLFNKNISTSDIARINSSAGKSVTVDHDTVLMLSDTVKYSEMTHGRFDISVEPISKLWDFHDDKGVIPDPDKLKTACNHVGYKNIKIDTDADTVTLPECFSIDPGAVAKGFIADRIAKFLSDKHITGAIINMGGDMRLVGTKPGGSDFYIGINDPFDPGSVISTLSLNNICVATSGTYERCFINDGRKYHHILDPFTGYPADTDVESVTVISGTSFDCDCLCTVCILEGSQKSLELIESIPDTEAILILSDKTVLHSSGASTYIRQ